MHDSALKKVNYGGDYTLERHRKSTKITFFIFIRHLAHPRPTFGY